MVDNNSALKYKYLTFKVQAERNTAGAMYSWTYTVTGIGPFENINILGFYDEKKTAPVILMSNKNIYEYDWTTIPSRIRNGCYKNYMDMFKDDKHIIIVSDAETTDPSAFSKFLNKKIEGDPKIIAAFDSLMEAKRAATLAEQEERRQHIRDSLAQYIHRRDSIRAELLREDSLRLELEKAKKAKIDYIAVIDDGITKRTVNVNSVVDTLTEEVTTQLGKTFTIMSVESAKESQKEIDRTKDYYKHLRIKTEQLL